MAGRTDTTAEADIRLFCGSTGSGKSHQIKRAAKDARRLLVCDPDDEYPDDLGILRAPTVNAAAKLARKRQLGPFRVAIPVSGKEQFGDFCRLAFAMLDARAPMTIAVDELADFDNQGKAPQGWGDLIRRARKYRGTILAGAQTPSEISKTLVRQRSYLWIGYLESEHDHDYLARRTRIPKEEIEALRGRPHFDAIEKAAGNSWRKLRAR